MERTLPLSNLQLEMLKLFSMNVDDQDLEKIKSLISRYFAEKSIHLADKEWDARKYTQEDMDAWLRDGKK